MSSSFAPAIDGAGSSPQSHAAAQPTPPLRPEPLDREPLAFARRVRSPWWQSCAPLLVTLSFGAALAFTAAAAPATTTVRRMLDAEGGVAAARAARFESVDPSASYELPAHWQWPGLSDATAVGTLVICSSNDGAAASC